MSSLLASALILLGADTAQEEPAPRVQGSPVQGSIDERQAEEAQQPEAPLAPPAPPRNLESLFGGALIGARDGEDFAETPGYRQLLETLSQYTDEELKQKVARPLDVPDALAHPDAWRGEIVSLRALLGDLRTVRFVRPLGEHVDAYRALLTKGDISEGVFVDFLEPPPGRGRRSAEGGLEPEEEELDIQHDVVDLEAVFFRTVRYENKKGQLQEAPYLIARSIRRMDPDAKRDTAFDDLAKILIGAASSYFVVRILFSMRNDKKPGTISGSSSRAIRERARLPLRPDPPANKI